MRLNSKLSLYAAALVSLVVAIMAVYQHQQIDRAAMDTYRIYMRAVVNSFVDQELSNRYRVLREAKLDQHPLYVQRYLEEAIDAAAQVSDRETGAIFLLQEQQNLSSTDDYFDSAFSTLKESFDIRQQPTGFKKLKLAGTNSGEGDYMVYWATEPDWEITVIFIKHDDDLHAATDGLGTRFIIVSVLLLLAAVLAVGYIYNRFIIQPVARLAQAARKISIKDFDFEIKKEEERELGLLAFDMEHMRQELESYHDLMKIWNEKLQEEVDRKTEDLKNKQIELNDFNIKLQQSNKELEQFAYVASHDLQEPLRMISSFLSLLQRRYSGKLDEKADEYIFYAVDGADRLKRMITDLLEFSRVATHGAPLEKCSLSECIEEAIINIRLKIEENKAEINIDELPSVRGDTTQLRQLFQNLFENSIKYRSEKTPCISVTAESQQDGLCRFSVSDNGVGIPDKYSQKAFMIFHRLHNDTETSGSGIGLAVCKKIVERHGGEISTCQNETGGTCVSFTLHLVKEHVQEIANATHQNTAG